MCDANFLFFFHIFVFLFIYFVFFRIHKLNVNELEKPLNEYKTFNEFFYRKLKPGARICSEPQDISHAVSSADCRLNVFNSVEEAQRLWIKGQQFTLGNLFK